MSFYPWKSLCVIFSLALALLISRKTKRKSKGAIFFLAAITLSLFGIISSKDIFFSLVNKASFSLFCFYVVFAAILSTRALEILMEGIFTLVGQRPLKLYLLFTALASFIPSKKVQKIMLAFLKAKKGEQKKELHAFFPVLFVLASSLTLMGSVTNIVSDYIYSDILKGSRWMFFTYGPLSFSLFFTSFAFFFAVRKLHKVQGRLLFSSPLPTMSSSLPEGALTLQKTLRPALQTSGSVIEGQSFSSFFKKGKKRVVIVVFLSLVASTSMGLQLAITAPIAAMALGVFGALRRVEFAKEIPWDLFLLVAAACIYSQAFIACGGQTAALALSKVLSSKFQLLTFFLFSSALISLFLPPLITIAFLLPLGVGGSQEYSLGFQQHLVAAITLGSFFLFPKRSLVVLDRMSLSSDEKLHLIALQAVWIALIFLVFLFHLVD